MTSVTLCVSSRVSVSARWAAAARGESQGNYISFATPDLLWKVLTAKRWEILQAMTGQGELAIREIARRISRDVKAVHGDITALIKAGLIQRGENGVLFPYDAIHVDFTIGKAA